MKPTYAPTLREVEDLYFRFNKTRDANLKYSEFMNAICPLSETYAAMLKQRKASKRIDKPKHPILVF